MNGFSEAIWSGLTTTALSMVIFQIIEDFPDLNGLAHVAGRPIDKYSLLLLCRKFFRKNIIVNKYGKFKSNKSLKINKILKNKIRIPTHEEMIEALAGEKYP